MSDNKQRHHLYYPRRAFRKYDVAKRFRQLPCNSVYLTAQEHREIHAQRQASEMPTREQMLQKLDLCKDCKGNCVSHSERIDHILGLIDEALGE